jgi:hypothetical protein
MYLIFRRMSEELKTGAHAMVSNSMFANARQCVSAGKLCPPFLIIHWKGSSWKLSMSSKTWVSF